MARICSLDVTELPEPRSELDLEPIVRVKEDAGERTIVITYHFPGFYLSERTANGMTFLQLDIPKTGFKAYGGQPLLPSLGRYLQIPFNCGLEGANGDFDQFIKVETSKEKDLSDKLGGLHIFPAQDELVDEWPRSDDESAQDEQFEHDFKYNEEFYESDELCTEQIYEAAGPFEIDGYNALLLHVTPFYYNPLNKRLIGYGQVTVTIDVSPKSEEEPYHFNPAGFNREAFGNFFLNPERDIELRLGHSVTSPRGEPGAEEELLIIYDDKFEQEANRLAIWKRQRGLRVKAVSLQSIPGNHGSEHDKKVYSPERRSEEIREYIHKKRQGHSSQLRYILLFGDVEQIPASAKLSKKTAGQGISIVAVSEQSDPGDFVTDYYYTTKDDPVDDREKLALPWLALGRIPVKELSEAKTIVDRIVNYEQDPPRAASYYSRMVFASDFEDSDKDNREDGAYIKTTESICQRMEYLRFDVERVYTTGNPNLHELAHKLSNVLETIGIKDKVLTNFASLFERSRASKAFRAGAEMIFGGAPPPAVKYIDGTEVSPNVMLNFLTDDEATGRIRSAIKKGCLILSHRGHGFTTYLHRPRLSTGDLNEIETEQLAEDEGQVRSKSEKALPMVFYSVNCLTGQFNRNRGEDSFAEKLLKMKGGGAPSLIAASIESNTWLNNYLFRALFDAVWSGIIPTFPSGIGSYPMKYSRIGDILEYAKLYIPLKFNGDKTVIKSYLEMYHVLGDPTLELWRASPSRINLRVQLEGSNLAITLLAGNNRRLSSCPMGSVVTIWRENETDAREPYKRVALQVPHFTISIRELLEMKDKGPAEKSVISICYWAPGYRFHKEKWSIDQNGRFRRSRT